MNLKTSSHRTNEKKSPKELVAADRLVKGLLRALGYDADVFAAFDLWDRLAGPGAKAVGLQNGCLCVEVPSHAHLQELALKKRGLLKKLNQHFGQRSVINDIIVQLSGGERQTFRSRRKTTRPVI